MTDDPCPWSSEGGLSHEHRQGKSAVAGSADISLGSALNRNRVDLSSNVDSSSPEGCDMAEM